MKKDIIYTNKDNQDFRLEPFLPNYATAAGKEANLRFYISNGCSEFYFLDSIEVDEFCELLQEKKKEIWQEK